MSIMQRIDEVEQAHIKAVRKAFSAGIMCGAIATTVVYVVLALLVIK